MVQKVIDECLEQNDFLTNGNYLMQLVEALGTGAFVAYKDKDILKINYLDATNIIILEADNKNVKSILFWDESNIKNGTELTINAHILTDKGYVIYNRKYIKYNGQDYNN